MVLSNFINLLMIIYVLALATRETGWLLNEQQINIETLQMFEIRKNHILKLFSVRIYHVHYALYNKHTKQ